VAADEIFANIVRYSGATRWSLAVELRHHPDGVRLVITDDGASFDPLAHRDPDTTLSAAEREIGGLGILIVKKTMSPVNYRRRNGKNVLTMGKDYGN
jgi:sigma-B regulation protein RsbU (phosphoserine phosphatase)